MDASAHFRGKKITLMGLGLLGRGVGDAKYLASCGAELIVTDTKSVEELAPSVAALSGFTTITFVLGEHRLEDFRERDMIIKSAGVPLDSPFIIEAENEGIPVKMSTSLFVEIAKIPIVGVTGTRGKSTTTHMLNALYEQAGIKVLLGGNVQGVSTLALLSEVTSEHIALFELDSWQLQGFGEAGISPTLSVFTTFYPDHLNYYHGDLERYLADKANIFLYQKPEDTLVLGAQASALVIEKYGNMIQSRVKVADTTELPTDWELAIPGTHNRYDAALALAAARVQGIADEVSKVALEAFRGVPGRLELVRILNGVAIYNDTTATTPDATLAALHAFVDDESKTILILGGADKGLDMQPLMKALVTHTKRVVFLAGTGTEQIRALVPDAEVYDNLAMAFADAHAHAEKGDRILFSPAFASFGMFTNEYDRGDKFLSVVRSYEN